MIYLFIHQNFPAQYKHLISYLADQPGNEIYFITQSTDLVMKGVKKLIYTVQVPPSLNCHPYTVDYDVAIRTGLAVAQICQALQQQAIQPDFIAGHSAWGETLFVKDVFPNSPLLSYFEFFYHFAHVDVNFDPEYPTPTGEAFRLRANNAVNLMAFDGADWGNTPTEWQRSLHPPEMRTRITTIHEGIDTDIAVPNPAARLEVDQLERSLTTSDEVITYVARNLEPYRGFHMFMRAAKEILRRRPKAHIVVIGGDEVSYGSPPPPGETFRGLMLKELGKGLMADRIYFMGQVSYEIYLSALQTSSAHIYLTYPFVLSWSFIEAMSCGCAIIGSDTPPVQEVLTNNENGLLADFFSPTTIADRVDQLLDQPLVTRRLRENARRTAIDRFDFKTVLLPRWLGLIDDLTNGRRPKAGAPRQ